MKKLLIPVDFSETSEMAVDFGVQLAKKCGYHIMLHHSVDFNGTYESMYVDAPHAKSFTEKVIEDMEIELENMCRKFNEDAITITRHITTGSLTNDVKNLVNEHEVSLLIMGTNGCSGLKEFLIGSNTEKIVRLVDRPVVSIPGRVNLKKIRRIVIPTNLNEIHSSFLREVSILQQLFSASIEFVWVKTPHDIENIEEVEDEFNNLLSEYEIASSSFTIVRDILPQEGLLQYVNNIDADMIAMATHGRRGISHLFSGSITEDVINHSDIPIWSYKMNQDEEPLKLSTFQTLKPLIPVK